MAFGVLCGLIVILAFKRAKDYREIAIDLYGFVNLMFYVGGHRTTSTN